MYVLYISTLFEDYNVYQIKVHGHPALLSKHEVIM